MASTRIKKVEIRDFGGIDRTASSNDSPIQKARISRDGRRFPTGKFVRRPEYDFLYDYRNQQFEHTTDETGREVRGDGAGPGGGGDGAATQEIPNGHQVYRSHGRKNICLGKSGTTEYTFVAYVEIHTNWHSLHLERGSRAATALDVTWTANGANCRKTIVSTPSQAGYANDWIEYSMVMNVAKNAIHLAVSMHDNTAGTTVVYHYTLTTLYAATVGGITSTLTATIESSNNITRDIDIEISTTGDTFYAIWGRTVVGDDVIRYASGTAAGVWTAVLSYTTPGLDFYGISLVLSPASTSIYMTYTYTEGGLRKLNYTRSNDLLISFGAQSQVATNQSTSILLADFYYRGVFAVDSGGDRHWVYLNDGGSLTHTYTKSVYGGVDAFDSQVMTAAVCLDATGVANEVATGWDFAVKNGCVSIFYVDNSLPLRTYKAVRVITSGDAELGTYNRSDYTETIQHDLIEVRAATIDVRYFGIYRKYERNSSLRLSWISCADTITTTNIRFLHSDKGLYEIDDTHTATNSVYADTNQVVIEAIKESKVTSADGSLVQILILQCDDNRLYKRVNYMWMLLEGQRLIDNSGWNWVTVYGDHARFLDYAGSVRMLAGDGATNQNAWYGYVDRYFFTNDAANRYADHYSNLARPPEPATAIVTNVGGINTDNDTYNGFTEIVDGERVAKSGVQSNYVFVAGVADPILGFHVAITYEQDGVEESQLRLVTTNGNDLVWVGVADENNFNNLIRLIFAVRTWNTVTNPTSARLTAVNIYLGPPLNHQQSVDATEIPPDGWYKVKRCQISAQKPVGDNAFADDDVKGTALWSDAGAGLFNLTTYVDYSMWSSRAAQGTAIDNLGTSLTRYQSTTSGTEIYTKLTTIPEGFKYGIVLQSEVWAASMRMAGVTRKNRLMRSARKIGNQVTPDGFTDQMGTWTDLPYEILGLSQIDDNNLVVIGKSGIDIFDISGGILNKRDDIVDIGTDATDGVCYIKEGAVGQIIKGMIFKDSTGNIRLFDGYSAGIISDPIRDNFALTSDAVDADNYGVLSLNSTSLIATYVPLHRTLWLIYGTKVYVWDITGGSNWQDWRVVHSITGVTIGVDGELFFTDGNTVFVWPQAGTIDNPNPLWRSSDVRLPEGMRAIPKKVWMDYICSTTTLQPKVWKDRGEVTDSTDDMNASTTQTTDRTGYIRSRSAARREIALGFGVTTAASLNSLEVDSLVQELLIVPRRP